MEIPNHNPLGSCKIPPDKYLLCLRMYAEGYTPAKILRYLKENNIPCPENKNFYLIFHRKTNQDIIDKFRKEYYNKVSEVPIMNKRIRADHLQRIANLLEKTIEKFTDKDGSLKISKESFNKANELLKRINDMLISARDEMEKRPQSVVQVFAGEISIEELINRERDIDAKLIEKRAKGLSIASLGEGAAQAPETPADEPEPT